MGIEQRSTALRCCLQVLDGTHRSLRTQTRNDPSLLLSASVSDAPLRPCGAVRVRLQAWRADGGCSGETAPSCDETGTAVGEVCGSLIFTLEQINVKKSPRNVTSIYPCVSHCVTPGGDVSNSNYPNDPIVLYISHLFKRHILFYIYFFAV